MLSQVLPAIHDQAKGEVPDHSCAWFNDVEDAVPYSLSGWAGIVGTSRDGPTSLARRLKAVLRRDTGLTGLQILLDDMRSRS